MSAGQVPNVPATLKPLTTVVPQNPFNKMENTSTTTNASLDSRPQVLIKDLPRSVSSPSKENMNTEKPEDKTDDNQNKN